MKDRDGGILPRVFFRGYRMLERVTKMVSGAYTAFGLGILRPEELHEVARLKYSEEEFYWTEEYNRRGLFDWERRAVEQHFQGSRRILVLAAGGGREVLALLRSGKQVDGFESHPGLARFAGQLLREEGLDADIGLVPWDRCPPGERRYDGAIVGWGAYMHIRGRETRVAFLREIRDRLAAGSPILLSFYTRMGKSHYFPMIARIGNLPARILGRDRVEVGDAMIPSFAHFFTRKEMERELSEGGYEMVAFETAEYGHAIGRAV